MIRIFVTSLQISMKGQVGMGGVVRGVESNGVVMLHVPLYQLNGERCC